jgi:chorismate synthase
VRHGKTIGSPVAMTLANNDWKNWEEILPVETGDPTKHKAVASPRPGHADLAGSAEVRLSRCAVCAGAGECAGECGAGGGGGDGEAAAAGLGVEVASHVIRVGKAELSRPATWEEIVASAGEG